MNYGYCGNCGEKLRQGEVFCPACGYQVEQMKQHIATDSAAGADVHTPAAHGAYQAPPRKKPNKGIIITAVVCSIAVLITGVFGGIYLKKKISQANQINPTGQTADVTTTENLPESKLSEADMRRIADDEIGNVEQFEYHDYDKDGTDEAFVVSAQEDSDGFCKTPWSVYFISADGQTKLMNQFSDLSYYFDDSKKYLEASDSHGFFCYNKGAYGSGWQTDIYTLKNGEPTQLDSKGLQGFNQKADGTFYTTQNEFQEGGGHMYPEYELIYNSSDYSFTIGSKID